MSKNLIFKYIERIQNFNDRDYLCALLGYYAAPTFAKYKPSSILTLKDGDRNLLTLWDQYKDSLCKDAGIQYFEIKKTGDAITILLYDEALLSHWIFRADHHKFLQKFGYLANNSIADALTLLKKRFETACPHEIGLFLGIPLKEVISFIECPNGNCLMCGYWKVYHDEEYAKITFAHYDQAKSHVVENILKGVLPSELLCGRGTFLLSHS